MNKKVFQKTFILVHRCLILGINFVNSFIFAIHI